MTSELTFDTVSEARPGSRWRRRWGRSWPDNEAWFRATVTVMASDSPESLFAKPQGFRVQISPSSRDEFDRVHDALAQDAQSVEMAPGETFWAERFAMFTGTPWMLNLKGNRAHG